MTDISFCRHFYSYWLTNEEYSMRFILRKQTREVLTIQSFSSILQARTGRDLRNSENRRTVSFKCVWLYTKNSHNNGKYFIQYLSSYRYCRRLIDSKESMHPVFIYWFIDLFCIVLTMWKWIWGVLYHFEAFTLKQSDDAQVFVMTWLKQPSYFSSQSFSK